MALINSETIDALNVTVESKFQAALEAEPRATDAFTAVMPVNNSVIKFPFLHPISGLNEWKDRKQIGNLRLDSVTLETRDWERTISIPRNAVRDDQLGHYNQTGALLARAGRDHVEKRVVAALQRGTSDLGFDGLAVFSTAHTLNPAGTQSNNLTGTALSATNFETAWETMSAYLGYDGQPLGIVPKYLVVPPQLAFTAKGIVESEFDSNGATNKYRGTCEVIVVPALANEATTWYLMAEPSGVKPVVYAERTAPSLVTLADPTDPNVFHNKEFLYSVEAAGEAILGPWFQLLRAIA